MKKVVIGGGGHNALVAACYLAKAGLDVTILEKGKVGGATVSQRVFPEFDARLSRYAYLIALLPDKIKKDLEIKTQTLSRSIASFTPTFRNGRDLGLLINSEISDKSSQDFQEVTGGESELKSWQNFYTEVLHFAQIVAPTMLEKLPTRSELRNKVNHAIWEDLIERPLGEALDRRFKDDLVKGIVLTDGLIGTFTSAYEMPANVCFIYHLVGNGVGEWKVPEGGMGSLVKELTEKAIQLGVKIKENCEVLEINNLENGYEIITSSGRYETEFFLANFAPQILSKLMGTKPPNSLDGAQIKINMLLKKLPRLKSGEDPRLAFAGTFHFDEEYSNFETAYLQAKEGNIPDFIPAEMYCHTLTDPTILSNELIVKGFHTLTLFGMHLPAYLFEKDNENAKRVIKEKLLNQLNRYLVDPIEDCLALASNGTPCIEVKSPLDIEQDVALPRGNIFHKDLSMPFREDGTPPSWGVETQFKNIFLCGAGAVRGGGVSGIPGHNAAQAVLETLSNLSHA